MDNRRKHQRYRAAVAVELELEGELYEGETRDLSSGGASVLLRAPLTKGMELQLTLFLTEDGIETPDEESLGMQAQVMWVSKGQQGNTLAGVRFTPPAAEEAKRLTRLLAALTPAG